MSYQTFLISWNDLKVELRYNSVWAKSLEKTYGEPLGHLELSTVEPEKAPMPISETGYRSEFLLDSHVTAAGGIETFARAMLDEAARSESWQAQQVQASQLSLF